MNPWEKYQSNSFGPWTKYSSGRGAGAGVSMEEAGIIAKEAIRPIAENVREFGRGAIRGATFGTMGQTASQKAGLEGSVFQPESEKSFGTAGKYVGGAVPVAAALTAGAPFATAAGAGSLGAAATGGAIYGGMRGAARNQPVGETVRDVATNMVLFPAVDAGFGVIKNFAKWLGGEAADTLSNWWLNTKNRTADHLAEQGRPSLGKQMLEKTSIGKTEGGLPNLTNRKQAYNYSKFESGKLGNQIEGRLQHLREQAQSPIENEIPVPENKRFLGTDVNPGLAIEYKPGQRTVIEKPPIPSDAPQRLRQGEQTGPRTMYPPKSKDGVSPVTEIYQADEFGVPVLKSTTIDPLGVPARRGSPGKIEGGLPEIRGKYEPDALGVPSYVGPEDALPEPTPTPSTSGQMPLAEAARSLKEPPRYRFATSRDIAISTEEIASSLDPLLAKYEAAYGVNDPRYLRILEAKQNFLKNNPEFVDIKRLNDVRKGMDYDIGISHEKSTASLPISTEAEKVLADTIRRKTHSLDPQLGEMFDMQHLYIQIQESLLPTVSKRGIGQNPEITRSILRGAAGSRATLAAARGFESTFGNPSAGNRAAFQGARNVGISIAEKNRQRFEDLKKNRKK